MVAATTARRVLVGLQLLAVVLLLVVLRPFASVLLVAAALAGALFPVQERLARQVRRRRLAAALLVFAVLFAVVLPLGGLVTFAVREAVQFVTFVASTFEGGGTDALIDEVPGWLQPAARRAHAWARDAAISSEGLVQAVGARGAQAAAIVGGAVAATSIAVVRVLLFLVALFFLLVDGARLVRWIEDVAPLAPGQARALLHEFRRSTSAVLRSALLTALVQTLVALAGYLVAGAPQPAFLSLVTFVVALVPVAGAAIVTVATGVVLLLSGEVGSGLFLCVWGVVAVGLVDNVVKPLLIRSGGMEVHPAVLFFALLGGLFVFGPVGLLVGPLAVSYLLAVVRLSRQGPEADTPHVVLGTTPPERPPDAPPPTLHG